MRIKYKEKIEEQKEEIKKLRGQLKEVRSKTKQQLKELESETRKRMAEFITAAFSFFAALFWRDAIQAFLAQKFGIVPGQGGTWISQIWTAFIITIIAVWITLFLTKFSGTDTQSSS